MLNYLSVCFIINVEIKYKKAYCKKSKGIDSVPFYKLFNFKLLRVTSKSDPSKHFEIMKFKKRIIIATSFENFLKLLLMTP